MAEHAHAMRAYEEEMAELRQALHNMAKDEAGQFCVWSRMWQCKALAAYRRLFEAHGQPVVPGDMSTASAARFRQDENGDMWISSDIRSAGMMLETHLHLLEQMGVAIRHGWHGYQVWLKVASGYKDGAPWPSPIKPTTAMDSTTVEWVHPGRGLPQHTRRVLLHTKPRTNDDPCIYTGYYKHTGLNPGWYVAQYGMDMRLPDGVVVAWGVTAGPQWASLYLAPNHLPHQTR